jgi:poly(A) polymerase
MKTGTYADATKAVEILRSGGFTAYLAGGCVRDLLMERMPVDYDIATSARPDDVLDLFPGSVAVGKSFGVVLVYVRKSCFDVATFREDHSYADGRHPESVSFTDAETDALRRDFTINAMFYDPLAKKVIDYVGGQADIEARVVRTVGDASERFAEDHLRMLRAVRFQSTLGFALDTETAAAIAHNAPLLARISTERIRDEFVRMLMESPRPGDAVVQLNRLGLLEVFLPEVAAATREEVSAFAHATTMLNVAHAERGITLMLTMLFTCLQERSRRTVAAILKRLRMSSADIDCVCAATDALMRIPGAETMKLSTLRKMAGSEHFGVALETYRLWRLVTGGDCDLYDMLSGLEETLAPEGILPEPWITGEDVVSMGVPKGPKVGRLTEKAYDLQLERKVENRESLLEWLREEACR